MFRPTINAVKFCDVKSTQPKNFALSWQGLSSLLQISVANADKTQRELWSPVIYRPNTTRGNDNVQWVTCLVVDMDGESFDYAKLTGLEYLAYTTWSHTEQDEHWHLVLPLAEPVPGYRWHEIWSRLHEKINVVGDPQTKDPARIFYRPQHKPLTTPDIKIGYGQFLDPELDESAPYVEPQRHRQSRTPNPKTTRSRNYQHFAMDPKWWEQPADISRFEGLSEREVLQKIAEEWQEVRKALFAN